MRRSILAAAALFTGLLTSSASVTVQAWYHLDAPDPYADGSGNGHRMNFGFSNPGPGSGNAGVITTATGTGGPLDNTTWISTQSTRFSNYGAWGGEMWGPGATDQGTSVWNPPATNYGIELWILPHGTGFQGGNTACQLVNAGGNNGAAILQLRQTNGLSAVAVLAGIGDLGLPATITSNAWTHLAIVNDGGVCTFYVNGVANGPSISDVTNAYTGMMSIGSYQGPDALMDEYRIFSFAPGAFTTNDLLLRPKVCLLAQPQPTTVWNNGAAPFAVNPVFDASLTYQWQRTGSGNIIGATGLEYILPTVTLADSGSTFDCLVTSGSTTVTSSNATLTVVANNPDNVNYYRQAVNSEPSLLAYFPVDGDTGATVSNTKDSSHNGTFTGNIAYDGRTNRAFGERALKFNANGYVMVAPNSAFEFSSGNGTIEALVYLDNTLNPGNQDLFGLVADYGMYYELMVTPDGSSIIYTNDASQQLSWSLPVPILGRQAHVALVIDHTNNLTLFVDGQSVGTKVQSSFGSTPGLPAMIGAASPYASPTLVGTVDELAIYSTALPVNTIAVHNSRFLYGTNVSAPTITGQSVVGSKTLLAGGSPTFTVKAVGTAPLAYQWTTNNVAIPGATSSSLTLSSTTTAQSGDYAVTVSNPIGQTNSQTFTLNFVAPPDSYAARVMNDNPSAYWRLDELSGTTAYDLAGAHDGTYMAGSSPGYELGQPSLTGASDPAVRFVAPNATYGGKVEVPYSSIFNNGPFTIECFCVPNYDGNDSGGYLVSSQNRPTGVRQGWMLGASANSVQYDFFLCDGSTAFRQVTGGPHCYLGVMHQVAGVYDGTNAYIVIDGVLSGTWTPALFVPNPSAPLEIAVRNGNGVAFDGVMDEVAYYNYALTTNQLHNHFLGAYKAAAITQQPVGVTNAEWSTVTLTAAATGLPNTYQWYRNGSPLTAVNNFDGTARYPAAAQGPNVTQGVNGPVLVITETHPSDSGSYYLAAINSLGNAQTLPVNVLITPDTNALAVVGAAGLATPTDWMYQPTPALVKVTFNKRLDPTSATTPGNYVLSGGKTVSQVNLATTTMGTDLFGENYRTAYLLVSGGLTPGQNYSVTVSGVKDQSQTPISLAGAQTEYFKAPVLTAGGLEWDYYYGVTNIGTMQTMIYTPTPQANGTMTRFDTTQITGGDLNNNPLFGSVYGDNYGDSLSGWITPATNGNYTFFLSSDDESQLYLSTDNNPVNVSLIASSTCCAGFVETGVNTSIPQTLVGGTRYFIQALHHEGTGGDYVKVAWREAAVTNAASTLQPIAGQYLSAYAPVPAPKFNASTLAGNGQLTISWTGQGTLWQSTDLIHWTQVPGNPSGTYTADTTSGTQVFFQVRQSLLP